MASQDLHWQSHRDRIDPQWERCIEDSGVHLSLSPFWTEAIAVAQGNLGAIHILAGDQGVLPYFIQPGRMYGLPVIRLELAGNLHSYHQEIPAVGDPYRLILELLATHSWHVLHAGGINVQGPTDRALERIAAEIGAMLVRYPGERSPVLPISTDWETYLAGRSRNFRYNLGRKRRRLEQQGLTERWITDEADADELLAQIWAIEEASWKVEADMAMLADSHERTLYKRLVPELARRGLLQANVLYLGEQPAAYSLCYRWRGSMGQIKTSFDHGLQKLGPGGVVTESAIRRAFDTGASEFDFLGPWMHHKSLWTDQIRPHDNIFLFAPNLRGRLLGWAKRLKASLAPVQDDPAEGQG